MPPEIECQLNGQAITTEEGVALTELIANQGYQGEGFATAVNGAFVPRSCYATTYIQAGDDIDIVAPVTGG
jgi:sulfur carrier protein